MNIETVIYCRLNMTVTSNKLREQGNQAFKQGKYQEAIDRYTEAIQLLANNQTDELTKCLSNRSQCYLNLNQYEEAIDDATRGSIYLFVRSFENSVFSKHWNSHQLIRNRCTDEQQHSND